MDKLEIINRIGYIRTRANLTQKALSGLIDMNLSYINRLESKKDFLPSLEVLMKIIEVCGSTTEEFFYGDISSYKKDKERFDKVKTLTLEQMEMLLKYDKEVMDAFNTINRKFVQLSAEDLKETSKPKK